MDIIIAPLIVWICVSGVYSLFELFVRRKERMMIIEKLSENADWHSLADRFGGKIDLPNYLRISFSSLKIGCLLAGLGLGLLAGVIISVILSGNGYDMHDHGIREICNAAYAASVLLFGGLGLLISFLIETKMNKNAENK
ncbi:MAG: hypothetical protein LBH90_00315 [Tannerella sp.]|jgi:hypothetical protein|nr:hypothetical protein [Tannerella sp.]